MYAHFYPIGAAAGEQISAVRLLNTEYRDHTCQCCVRADAHVHELGGEPFLRFVRFGHCSLFVWKIHLACGDVAACDADGYLNIAENSVDIVIAMDVHTYDV
ncbi:hypothetical protein KH389_26195 [Pseudomonas qingdaonensis]|jgi:hypothetical protein|uniref:Uncharacterized protein n=1 Tax=Pseudomonas qingdaonensis TaxID=2056231 RepID=A0ABX8DRE4_9PSED|nr:hypothetical protein [Pseudomonas qingdaonensis]QVL18812.1 hypothetical protein KH389_26195 [Pseudomonas qingdaonensis]